jgi:hypothetical protein
VQDPEHILDISAERDRAAAEVSDERFDRAEFTVRALELVRPRRTTVAICHDAAQLRVESGPRWGHPGEAWAMLAIPRHASRRAIALAVVELAGGARAWVLDVLLGAASEPAGE